MKFAQFADAYKKHADKANLQVTDQDIAQAYVGHVVMAEWEYKKHKSDKRAKGIQ